MIDINDLYAMKENTRLTILKAMSFMVQHGMDRRKTKVRSTAPNLEKYGIWPTTEFLEFLLTNDVLPITNETVKLIEGMIEFVIAKYRKEEKKWPLTDAKGSIASAITTGHCIYVLKLYVSRPFIDYVRAESIKEIIREAENTLIDDCRKDGSWKIMADDDAPDIELNFGRFFYSYNAWFGIKKVQGYTDNLAALPSVKKRCAEYVIGISDVLLHKAKTDNVKNKSAMLCTLICNMAKAIQILNDYDDGNCVTKKKELCDAILQLTDSVERDSLLYSVSSVEISELPNSGYNKFSNNIPFDLFFAIKDEPQCAGLARDIINWYLTEINTQYNCWFFPDTNMNTWPTCEALLVLSYAHDTFFEVAMRHSCEEELCKVAKKHEQCEACKTKINCYLKPQKERFEKSMADYTHKVKRTNIISFIITVFVCCCAIAALIALSKVLEEYWINTLITVVVVPLILQIIFALRMPGYSDEAQQFQKELLETIEESADMWRE